MKTHQEIRDVIDLLSTHYPDDAATEMEKVLHVLNDRIEALRLVHLKYDTASDVAAVEKHLEEIHLTIT